MEDDEIYAIADDAAQRAFDRIPNEHLERLDEEGRGQLLVDFQDALTGVLREAFGTTGTA